MRITFLTTLGILLTTVFLTAIVWLRLAPSPSEWNPANVALEGLPKELGEWRGENVQGLGLRSKEVLKLDSYVRRIYRRPSGDEVVLYIGYWRSQGGDYQAAKHSPAICLPSNGWRVEPTGERILAGTLSANTLLGSMGLAKLRFYYWFFSGTHEYTHEWQSLMNLALSSLGEGRLDGGIVEISTPHNTPESAIDDFARVLIPELRRLLLR